LEKEQKRITPNPKPLDFSGFLDLALLYHKGSAKSLEILSLQGFPGSCYVESKNSDAPFFFRQIRPRSKNSDLLVVLIEKFFTFYFLIRPLLKRIVPFLLGGRLGGKKDRNPG